MYVTVLAHTKMPRQNQKFLWSPVVGLSELISKPVLFFCKSSCTGIADSSCSWFVDFDSTPFGNAATRESLRLYFATKWFYSQVIGPGVSVTPLRTLIYATQQGSSSNMKIFLLSGDDG